MRFKRRSSLSGRNNKYITIRLPQELVEKYSLEFPCFVDIEDCEQENGILIKKSIN